MKIGCRRSNFKFWIGWISNSLDQWHQIAFQILGRRQQGSCIILSQAEFTSNLVMHIRRGKSLHAKFLRSAIEAHGGG